MYDELVKRLRDFPKICAQYDGSIDQLHDEAADAIEELMAERDEVNADSWKRAFEVERDERRWIPVTERLPEKDGTFITAYSKGGVSQNWYMTFHHGGGKWYQNSEDTGEVTHWMPLPTPPKEE